MTMLDQLIQAALEESAQRRKLPPDKAEQPASAWLRQCENRGKRETDST